MFKREFVYKVAPYQFEWDYREEVDFELIRTGNSWAITDNAAFCPANVNEWIDSHSVAFEAEQACVVFDVRVVGESGDADMDPLPGVGHYYRAEVELLSAWVWCEELVDQVPHAMAVALWNICRDDVKRVAYDD